MAAARRRHPVDRCFSHRLTVNVEAAILTPIPPVAGYAEFSDRKTRWKYRKLKYGAGIFKPSNRSAHLEAAIFAAPLPEVTLTRPPFCRCRTNSPL